ncbi:YbhB/YbcL family Raf kinase inhibitor-like protein [Leifsonia poae]|uniref:YbhB/YbcL family Raf kinase inhibitor-like protein n=1 Tax=Leifsonia poae TaxID=110933 RepID=UPI001CBCB427|nr:YbhB/YbcL family Raf kinase inhibitor-like protein [Leifsonia poae]
MPNPLGLALRSRRVGQDALLWAQAPFAAPETFTLTSPAFAHGDPIPVRHRGHLFAANISPALVWTEPPSTARELVLIVQDPDVPLGRPAVHALAVGIDPSAGGLPENALVHPSPLPGIRQGRGALGRRGWAGPLPLRSHGPHSYVFQLFALDRSLDLPATFSLDHVVTAMIGHTVARARLDGTYEIR